MNRSITIALLFLFSLMAHGDRVLPQWTVTSLPYRVLVEVPAFDIGSRKADNLPASVELDFSSPAFSSLKLSGPVDLDSIQVIRYDPSTGKSLPAPVWPFARTQGEVASRFIDKSLPWDFPLSDQPVTVESKVETFPRGAYLMNAKGSGNPGILVWDHTQDGNAASHYAIYFRTLKKGERQTVPRQGFVGDGSPRRDIGPAATGDSQYERPLPTIAYSNQRGAAPTLTGTLYNSPAVDDWDGDGLNDLLVGVGSGNILLFHNEGDKSRPKFNVGEYLVDADGRILDAGSMVSPVVVDWNGDGIKDLVVGEEQDASVVWYQNTGTNSQRKFVYRGHINSDGKMLVVPAKPCPESPFYTKDYTPAVEVIDWDGDGDPDLILGGYVTGYIWYYENVGTSSAGTPTLEFRGPIEADGKIIDTIWGAHPSVVDIDGDGDLDLMSGSFGQDPAGGNAFNHFLILYENIGTRRSPKLTERRVQYEGEEPRDIIGQPRPLDFNTDGLVDFVVGTYEHVYLARHVGMKKSPKWKVEVLQAPWGVAPLAPTQLIDLNADGYLDIVQASLDSDDEAVIRMNKGQGSHGVFGPPRPLLPPGQKIIHRAPYGDQWNFVYIYDFDQDGVWDILWADGPGYVYLHRNRGTNQKTDFDIQGEKLLGIDGEPIKVGPPVVASDKIPDFVVLQGSRAGLAATDFNRDGKTDLAVGDTYGDVYYFENVSTNQTPRFAQGVKLGNLSSRAIPLAYDWNGDGRTDVVGTAWSSQLEWYPNLASGDRIKFGKGEPIKLPATVPYGPRMVIADWNGDGDQDYLVIGAYPWFCWLDASYVKHGYAVGRITSVESR